jgi:hypothetical protein
VPRFYWALPRWFKPVIAVGLIAYAFLAAYAAISLAPASFWVDINKDMGVPDIQKAYAILFGRAHGHSRVSRTR